MPGINGRRSQADNVMFLENERGRKGREGGELEFVLHLFALCIGSVCWELARVLNNDIVDRLVAVSLGDILDVLDDIHSFEDAAKDCTFAVQRAIQHRFFVSNFSRSIVHPILSLCRVSSKDGCKEGGRGLLTDVSVVQPARFDGANEELSTIRVRTGISHAQNTRTGMLKVEILIVKLATVDTVSTPSITPLEIATLDHKVADHTVELATLVTVSFLTRSKGSKVLGGLGNVFTVQAECDTSYIFVTVLNVEVDLVGYDGIGSGSGGRRGEGDQEDR